MKKTQTKKDTKKSKEKKGISKEVIKIIIFLVIYASAIIYASFRRSISGFLIALITIITAKISCPNNKLIKVLYWLSILALIIFIWYVIETILTCSGENTCQG